MNLPKSVKQSDKEAGLIPYCFNTIGISDNISIGTTGIRYPLRSREIIADSIESVMGGQWYDTNISLPGCDKNMPSVLIAIGGINRLSLHIYRSRELSSWGAHVSKLQRLKRNATAIADFSSFPVLLLGNFYFYFIFGCSSLASSCIVALTEFKC